MPPGIRLSELRYPCVGPSSACALDGTILLSLGLVSQGVVLRPPRRIGWEACAPCRALGPSADTESEYLGI